MSTATTNNDFGRVLRSRVNQYFKENEVSRFANANMVLKTIFMLALYLVPFILILTVFESPLWIVLMWILMGFGMSGIGLSIMHDANHHAYSRNKHVNVWLGRLIILVGGNDMNWRIQHNVLHHTYTNVTGMDEDIDAGALMRFSPDQERRKLHKYQYIYAWFLYGFLTLAWALIKDYQQYASYKKRDLIKTQGMSKQKALKELIISKMVYLGVFLVVPLIFSSLAWWQTILCFSLMHFISGLILSCIFQPAHVIPESDFPTLEQTKSKEFDWAASQLMNTANFAPKARVFSWYVGGLNYQIEHHLFPNICHVHYRNISKIVRETAAEYGVPYYTYKTFMGALLSHGKLLYKLGRA